MARLSGFKINSKAIENGQWVSPGEEYDDLQILTRGFTDLYTDARAAKLRRAALAYSGETTKVPNSIQREILVECMIEHVLLDVRNLTDDQGSPVDFARFCDLLRDPDYADLVTASIRAASLVGKQRLADTKDAAGNSATPSA